MLTRPLRLFRAFGPPPDTLVRAPLMTSVMWAEPEGVLEWLHALS